MTHISARVQVYAHNQPKLAKPGIRIASLSWRHGGKKEPVPLAAILFAINTDVADFYVASGAASEEEGLVQMRKLIGALERTVAAVEQELRHGAPSELIVKGEEPTP